MSYVALRLAFRHVRQNKFTPSTSLVLLCLANRHHSEIAEHGAAGGHTLPTTRQLVRDTGLSPETVRKAIKELIKERCLITTTMEDTNEYGDKTYYTEYEIDREDVT